MSSSTDTAPEPQAETRRLPRCHHADCRVDYVCKSQADHAEGRGAAKFLQGEIDRLKKLETENSTLRSRIFELEDRFSEELECKDCGGDGQVICSVCNGLDDVAPRESAAGYRRTTCSHCDRGMVPCSECGEGAGA